MKLCAMCVTAYFYLQLFVYLYLQIALLDHLPQKICEKCLNIVNKVSELRQIAMKNDKQLKLLFYDGEMGKEVCFIIYLVMFLKLLLKS